MTKQEVQQDIRRLAASIANDDATNQTQTDSTKVDIIRLQVLTYSIKETK
jgi:hypothetical protein